MTLTTEQMKFHNKHKLSPAILTVAFVLLSLMYSCDKEKIPAEKKIIPKDTLTAAQKDSIAKAEMIAENDTFPKIKYKKHILKSYKERLALRGTYDKKRKLHSDTKSIITLNRQELRFIHIKEEYLVPDSIAKDMRLYSIFPYSYYEARNIPKIIMVSNKYQCYGCYENGILVRFAATNTGKERTQTYPGRYALEWKEREHLSSLDSTWKMPYTINFHAQAGNAFHQFSMPGRPVSHSCCRQFMSDAKWLYSWGKGFKRDSNRRRIRMSGTPVVIIDYFDFSRKKGGPWLELKSNKDLFLELPDDPMAIEEAVIPWSQIPVGSRWALKDKDKYKYGEDTLRARGVLRPHVKLIETKNFNDERRKKARAKAKKEALEKKKAEEAKKMLQSAEPDTSTGHISVPPSKIEEEVNENSKELENEIKSLKKRLQNEEINR